MKFELSLFRFDYKSDYLPYYTKHKVKIQTEQTLLDIFKTIHEEQAFGFENSDTFVVVVNGMYTYCNISIAQLQENFGKELTIEPMSIRRAHSDLLVNEEDFKEKFEILSTFASIDMLTSYIDPEIVKLYEQYKIYFYASNTLNFEKNYIGDAILLLACDLIQKFPEDEKKILNAIAQCDKGIDYHTSLQNRVYNLDATVEEKITWLKKALGCTKDEQDFKVNRRSAIEFGAFQNNLEIKHDFNTFNIAYYEGSQACEQTTQLLDSLSAKKISLESASYDLAMDTFHKNPDLTYKIASSVILEAFDQNADFLLVDSDDLFYLFDYNRKELQRVSGRDILLPVIHKNELEKLATGVHGTLKESLKKHMVNPELI